MSTSTVGSVPPVEALTAAPSRPRSQWWPVLWPVVALALVAYALLTLYLDPGLAEATYAEAVWLLAFLLFPAVGAALLVARPGHAVGRLFVAAGLCAATAAFVDVVAQARVAAGVTGPVLGAALLLQDLLWMVGFLLATVFPLLFYPNGRLPSPRWRAVAVTAAAVLAVLVLAAVLAPGPFDGSRGVSNPFGVTALGAWPDRVDAAMSAVLTLLPAVAMAALVVRWRRSAGVERQRLAWVALAAVVLVVLGTATFAAEAAGAPYAVVVTLVSLAIAALPVATAVGILRVGLFDIEVVLDRVVVYSLLTGAVLACYAGTLAATTAALGMQRGGGASLLASAVVAVALSPVKDRLHRGVDRMLFGDRSRPYTVLAGLARRLHDEPPLHRLVGADAAAVGTALRLPYARVVLAQDDDGATPTDGERVDLVAQGATVGVLLAGWRPGERGFDARESELLDDVARQIAAAVAASRLAAEVEQSREHIVRAREAERLRIRRDLHDGVGPVLAAVALRLDALGDHVAPDRTEARSLLDSARDEVRGTLVAVRRVVEGLRPASLDELGLVGVLHEQAATLRLCGLAVDVEVETDGSLRPDPAIEVAAHRILTEAVSNVAQHAEATRCRLSLRRHDHRLVLVVADDGRGIGTVREGAVGLTSMRDRAAELGGATTVTASVPHGTTVTARLPLGPV